MNFRQPLTPLIASFVCAGAFNHLIAQVTFQKTYGSGQGHFGNKYDYAAALQQTQDGGYIIAGHTDGSGLGLEDVLSE